MQRHQNVIFQFVVTQTLLQQTLKYTIYKIPI